jgi:polyisoprenyl-phosphate glycosyltransferase
MMPPARTPLAVVMPVFNDAAACGLLLGRLDEVLAARFSSVPVVIVDDGSTETPPVTDVLDVRYACLEPAVLRLRRNLGHQRALCVGLAYAYETLSPDVTVIMDSDGEDAPEDVPRLLDACAASGDHVVFARRAKRSESLLFRAGYVTFRLLHRIATGHGIAFGNFSAVPRERLVSLLSVGDLWNNYAASVLVSRQPYCAIPTTRARRLGGRTQMKLLSLVAHGLGAISVFGEVVSVRLAAAGLLAALPTLGLLLLGAAGVGSLSLPVLILVAVMALASLQVTGFALLFAFITLSRRSASLFQPARDYRQFVDRVVGPDVRQAHAQPLHTA